MREQRSEAWKQRADMVLKPIVVALDDISQYNVQECAPTDRTIVPKFDFHDKQDGTSSQQIQNRSKETSADILQEEKVVSTSATTRERVQLKKSSDDKSKPLVSCYTEECADISMDDTP